MASKRERLSKVIIVKLLLFGTAFYALFFIVSIILLAAFSADLTLVGRTPFAWDVFNPAVVGIPLGMVKVHGNVLRYT